LCHVGECEAETEEDDADAQNAFAAKLQPATPLLGEVTAERVRKNDTYENADNEGRKRQVLEKREGTQSRGDCCEKNDEQEAGNGGELEFRLHLTHYI